jgi:large subunit ribosomal protein L33
LDAAREWRPVYLSVWYRRRGRSQTLTEGFGPCDTGPLAASRLDDYDPGFTTIGPRSEIPMAKGKKRLEVIHLVCEETGDQNYTLRRKTGGEKLKVKKYSPRLRKHTVHNEKRK